MSESAFLESKQADDKGDKLGGVKGIAADAIISVDDEQRIMMYNSGAETIFGWTAAEAVGRSLDLLLPERFRNIHGRHLRNFGAGEVKARRMGQRTSVIFGLRKNGDEFPAEAAISKIEVHGNSLFTVVLRDTSERTRHEKDRDFLAEAAMTLADTVVRADMLADIARLVVRDLADFCIVDLIDNEGKLRRKQVLHRDAGEKALCETFERLPLAGQAARVVASVVESKQPRLIGEVPPRFFEAVDQSDESGEHLRALRELAPRSLMVVPLLTRGTLLGTLVLVSSHPSRRYGEEDLRLAAELACRTALAIENARLYEDARRATHDLREANQHMVSVTIRAQELMETAQAARALAEANALELLEVAEFREMFIGILGHDLRNPLGSIRMASGLLLRRGNLDEQAERQVARIVRSSDRMARMISQLLDLTRARLGGGFPLEPKAVDLRVVCRSVVEEFEAPVQLEVEGDLTGTWDPDRLAEAISNIAGNALEHATPGTTVVVKAHAEGPHVVVEIINQGEPIPADVLPFIFEPFRRAKRHEKSATGNLGLGLYIAHEIVRSGGGTLVAHSAAGTTTFSMRMPRHPAAAPAVVAHAAPEN